MSAAELRFRKIETLLDHQLAVLRSTADLSGVEVHDWCARNYHYKNEVLTWSYQFVRDTLVDGEFERISVRLSYMEPLADDDTLAVFLRRELFQQGQISRIDRKHEYRVAIDQGESAGLEPILKNGFTEGPKLLRQSANRES